MAIRQINLPDGRVLEIDEWLHWPTYSTIEFAAAVKLQLNAFNYIQGGTVSSQGLAQRSSTVADTNQTVKRQVNYDEALLVYDLTYETFALTNASITTDQNVVLTTAPAPMLLSTNLHRLQRDMMVELKIGADQSKPQFRAPLSYIGQAVGAPAWSPGDVPLAGFNISYGTGGYPTPENARRLELPVYIQPKQTMYLKIYSISAMTDMTQAVRMRWYLDGLKRRPVG